MNTCPGDDSEGAAALVDFGVRYCGAQGKLWFLLVSRLHVLVRTNDAWSSMYRTILAQLAVTLEMPELLQALPDDTDLSVFLEAVYRPF